MKLRETQIEIPNYNSSFVPCVLDYLFFKEFCKGTFWFSSSKGKRIKAQKVQHNEFVESGLEIRLQWVGQQS